MDLVCDNYLKALVIKGDPPIEILVETDYNLRTQYADAIGDHEYLHYCNLLIETIRLETTLVQIENIVKVLKECYNKVLANLLNRLCSSSFDFDITNYEDYTNKLQRCLNRSKSLKINIDLKKMALEKLEAKQGKGSNPKREYFLGTLITLSDDSGYPLREESVTVWEFCERIKRFNKKIDQLKLSNHGRRQNR